jgi:hypothetical protein
MATVITLLINQTLSASTASVTFANITQDYRDLILVCTYSQGTGGNQPRIQINADTGSSYSVVGATGYSTSSVASWSYSSTEIHPMNYTGITAGETGLWKVEFLDYSASDRHKTVLSRSNHSGEVDMNAARWANTAAITSVAISPQSGTFNAGSTFYLYGVTA